jgi:hypothetical protein
MAPAAKTMHPQITSARQSPVGVWEPQMTQFFATTFRRTASLLTVGAPIAH